MKKLALSLLGAATLALSSNAMALDTTRPYFASISLGAAAVHPVGTLFFDFDQDLPFVVSASPPGVPPTINPGACMYVAEWVSVISAGLPLTALCYFAEQKTHGSFSCIDNSLRGVPTFLTAGPNPNFLPPVGFVNFSECDGVDPWNQISKVLNLQLAENFIIPGVSGALLQGVVQFDGIIANHSLYGLQLVG